MIAFALIVFFGMCLYRRQYGIYLIILGLPAYQIRFQALGIPMTFLEGMILLLMLSMSLRGAVIRDEAISIRNRWLYFIRNDKLASLFILLFLLAAGISVFIAPDMIKAAGIFKAYFFEAILFYFLLIIIIDSRSKFDKLLKSLALLVIYLSLFGLYQFLTLDHLPASWWGVNAIDRRIISLVNHPNALALLLGPILAMLVFLPKNKLNYTAILLGLPAFYLTLSRAGWLALIAVIFGIKFFSTIHNPLNPPYLKGEENAGTAPPLKLRGGWEGLLLSLSIIVIIIFAVPYSRTKLLNLASGQDPTQQNRYLLWSAGADLIKKHPLTGVGLMGFHEEFKNYPIGPDRVVQNYPHNFFLNFWVETGLLGLASMLGLLILFAKKNRNLLRTEFRTYALAFAAAMAMIIIHSLVDVSYFKNDLAILFWLIYALPFIPHLSRKPRSGV